MKRGDIKKDTEKEVFNKIAYQFELLGREFKLDHQVESLS